MTGTGLHGYSIYKVDSCFHYSTLGPRRSAGGGLRNVLSDCGTLVGLAGIVYLPAPDLDDQDRLWPPIPGDEDR